MPHKLLLADDSVTIQRVVELTFSSEDVQVLSVADGEEAIARIPIDQPDIVLADIGMPRRTGYEVSAYVKDRPELAHIPVLLMAGAFEPVDEARARQVRSDGVLIKPFEPQQVIARVRELLQNSRRVEPAASALPGRHVLPGRPAIDADADADAMNPAPAPPAREQRPGSEGSLDDYFDRLDAAFAGLGGHPPRSIEVPARAPVTDHADEPPIPSLEDLLAARSVPPRPIDVPPPAVSPPQPVSVAPPPIEPPDSHPTRAPAPAEPSRPSVAPAAIEQLGRNVVAEAFGALLAVERGEPGASPIRLPVGHSEPVVTDAVIDEIARRVLDRLGTNANQTIRDLVIRIVSDVSERLVEQEIRRIRSGQ